MTKLKQMTKLEKVREAIFGISDTPLDSITKGMTNKEIYDLISELTDVEHNIILKDYITTSIYHAVSGLIKARREAEASEDNITTLTAKEVQLMVKSIEMNLVSILVEVILSGGSVANVEFNNLANATTMAVASKCDINALINIAIGGAHVRVESIDGGDNRRNILLNIDFFSASKENFLAELLKIAKLRLDSMQ